MINDFDDIILALGRADNIKRFDREQTEISYGGVAEDDTASQDDTFDSEWYGITDTVVWRTRVGEQDIKATAIYRQCR